MGGLTSALRQRVGATAVIRSYSCWELLSISLDGRSGVHQFTLPVDRWVFIQCESRIVEAGRIKLFLDDGDEPVIDRHEDGFGEAMRYLKAGVHHIRYSSVGERARADIGVRGVRLFTMPATAPPNRQFRLLDNTTGSFWRSL